MALLAGLAAASAAPLTTADLLREMADLDRLAKGSTMGYTNRQFSSWDRSSRIENGRKVNWFANRDAGHYLRDEKRGDEVEHVMMDVDGPGVITRIWSANPDKTRIRFYLDGAAEPTYEADFLELTTGKVDPFIAPFSHRLSGGANLYFPIPYARHCKVTQVGGGIYYHINYRTYPAGTQVHTFQPSELPALKARVEQVARVLTDPDTLNPSANRRASFALSPGQEKVLLAARGPAAIRFLALRVGGGDTLHALRNTRLRITFDDAPMPQVECPLGDFFGTGPGANAYVSLPVTVTKEGEMRSRFVMPFERRATLTLTNLGQSEVAGELAAAVAPCRWNHDTLQFHAKWRADHDIPTRPFRDMRYISVDGRGRYVGTALSLTNPWKAWWGEGDEKIYVDGETFPSHMGTGTEDYFSYAWGDPHVYTHAYHAQPRCDGPGTFGYNSEVRWHLFDDIPFERSLTFDLELWHWGQGILPTYGRMAYYYAAPGATDDHLALKAGDLRLVPPPEKPLD